MFAREVDSEGTPKAGIGCVVSDAAQGAAGTCTEQGARRCCAHVEGVAPLGSLDASAGVGPVVGGDGGHALCAAVLRKGPRQPRMQRAPLREGDELVRHIARQHLRCPGTRAGLFRLPMGWRRYFHSTAPASAGVLATRATARRRGRIMRRVPDVLQPNGVLGCPRAGRGALTDFFQQRP